jgi:hypothetical protein
MSRGEEISFQFSVLSFQLSAAGKFEKPFSPLLVLAEN